jgi:integrase
MPRQKGTGTGTRNLNGMGNLYFNKGTGRYEYRIMTNGRVRVATGTTPKEVNERKKQLVNTARTKQKIKFHSWVETWLTDYVKPYKKASTHKQYEDTWKCYIKPHIKNVPLSTVDAADIQKLIAGMHSKCMSANSMKQARKVLNLIFKQAIKEKYITANPAADIEIPAVQQKARKVLTKDELQRMFYFLRNSRWYWPLRFMLVTGLRRGELLALKWTDIDEARRVITVSDNLTKHGIGSTKSNKVHYVSYPKTAQRCLDEYKKVLEKEGNPSLFRKGLIFTTKFGEPLKPQSLNNVFRRIQEGTQIEVSPHSMRHTFVYYSKNKLTLSELKDNLGHDETTATLDIYGDFLFDAEAVANKLDEAWQNVVSEDKPKEIKKVVNFGDIKKRKKRY